MRHTSLPPMCSETSRTIRSSVVPSMDERPSVADLVGLDLGEEPHVAQVHPHQRGPLSMRELGGPQDRAVPADHERELAIVAGVVHGVGDLDRPVPRARSARAPRPHPRATGRRSRARRRRRRMPGDLARPHAAGVGQQQDPAWRMVGHGTEPLIPAPARRRQPRAPLHEFPRGSAFGARRSHRKYSTLPAGPGSGLVATPGHPSLAGLPRPRPRSPPRPAGSGSRTTPPLPTRSFPPRTAASP